MFGEDDGDGAEDVAPPFGGGFADGGAFAGGGDLGDERLLHPRQGGACTGAALTSATEYGECGVVVGVVP